MANQSSLKIILESFKIFLYLLSGVGLGVFMNNRVLHDGHEIKWNHVICFLISAIVLIFIRAIVKIKRQNKRNT